MPKKNSLSKSKLMAWRQCPRKLWLSVHNKDAAVVSPTTQARFARGNEVGGVARAQIPGGVYIDTKGDMDRALKETAAALRQKPRRSILEATFAHDDCRLHVDALIPEGRGYRLCGVG
mgnify:CR=1 FL=1